MRKKPNKNLDSQDIPEKANRILNIVLIFFVLIAIRSWHLAVVEHDTYLELSKKPQKRIVIEPSIRGTIRDRFNIPLAINKIQYNASIIYSRIQSIPAIAWKKEPDGKKIKIFKRREYIEQLARLIAKELDLDKERVEDLIHSKASFYGHLPYTIRENITEKQYYRLKMLEKDWIGLHLQTTPRRYYPKKKLACDIIGYMGSISRNQYDKIVREMRTLKEFITRHDEGEDPPLPQGIANVEEARHRYHDLQEKTYTINDYVGKSGIEAYFEETLRGFYGKKSYYSDARGNFLRELPGSRQPLPGQRVLLSISSELQEYGENLLIQNEKIRQIRISSSKNKSNDKSPWIKGGAIVMLDPNNGEVLCMASTPRFDPNDFITSGNPEERERKNSTVKQWLETDGYIADLWHRKKPLEREVFHITTGTIDLEKQDLTWENYLNYILPIKSPVIQTLNQIGTIKNAIELQKDTDLLMQLGGIRNAYGVFNEVYADPYHKKQHMSMRAAEREELEENLTLYADRVKSILGRMNRYFNRLPQNYDKILVIDLCRIAVSDEKFTPELLNAVGNQKISDYLRANMDYVNIEELTKGMAKELFHEITFKEWKEKYRIGFLKEKRAEEKAKNLYAKPYLDYFDSKENELFNSFWKEHKYSLILSFLTGYESPDADQAYSAHFSCWHKELDNGAHAAVRWRNHYDNLKSIVHGLPPNQALQYLATFRRFEDLDRELLGKYRSVKSEEGKCYEKHLAAAFYPRYGFCFNSSFAYRLSSAQGSTFKLIVAYEALIQKFNALKGIVRHPDQLNPLTIEDRIFRKGKEVFYGKMKDGTAIPNFYKGGRLIKSLTANIGEVDIVKALENSSNPYFSILAAEYLESPKDLERAARDFSYGRKTGIQLPAEVSGKIPDDLDFNRAGLYAVAIGQHSLLVTPLQTAVMLSALANGGKVFSPKIVTMIAGRAPNRNFDAAIPERDSSSSIQLIPSRIQNEISLPKSVQDVLFKGMEGVIGKIYKNGFWSLASMYNSDPGAISDLLEMEGKMIGKTSTGEVLETIDLDLESGTNMYNHVWFAGIIFEDTTPTAFVTRDKHGKPEVVVIVFLRYGSYGKDAAPIAAQMAKKWRKIKEKYKKKIGDNC